MLKPSIDVASARTVWNRFSKRLRSLIQDTASASGFHRSVYVSAACGNRSGELPESRMHWSRTMADSMAPFTPCPIGGSGPVVPDQDCFSAMELGTGQAVSDVVARPVGEGRHLFIATN